MECVCFRVNVNDFSSLMKKVELMLSQFERDLIREYGRIKFFIYYHWRGIINSDKRFANVALKKISYEGENCIVIYVCPANPGSAVKLRHCATELEEQIKLRSKLGCEIRLVLSS